MLSQKALSQEEQALLSYFLKVGNYQTGTVALPTSQVMDYLKLDMTGLARVLRRLSSRGLIRLSSLPPDLEEILVRETWKELDLLDLRYLESHIAESQYVLSRAALTDQLKMFPHKAEPLSPLEAAKLFRQRDRTLGQILQLTKTSQSSELSMNSEALVNLLSELLLVRDKLLPFRKFIVSRISELGSKAEERVDSLDERRMRMLLLFSQVGLSRLATATEVAQDLLEELEVLRARGLVGEIPESDLKNNEEMLWNEIWKRMTPQLPNHEDFARWVRGLNVRLDAARSLRDGGMLTEDLFKVICGDLAEDLVLLRDW